ncbi:MAG: homoserine kinase [Aquificota bacterium]|jgi:homoserine kinase|nr:homoserine kinase [Aquificaceae bacterium]HCO39002.1 homoserine kinase [Aquificaceae bacterium]
MLKIKVPASTSNFGAGFDAFGLALSLYNEFYVEPSGSYNVQIEGEGLNLPTDEENLFIKVYKRACKLLGKEELPISLKQINRVPTARGLGSSATAIVGGILACQALHGLDISLEEKLKIAFEFERHPDNLLPAFLGGFVVCASTEEGVKFIRLDFPKEIKVVVCVPDFELSTEKAREVIKKEVSLKDAVFNLQRSALFVASLLSKNFELLKEAVKDRLHQPYRAHLIPGFWQVLEEAYKFGALAVFLSGAGPSVASLCLDKMEEVGNAMVKAFEDAGVKAKYMVLEVAEGGASVEYEGSNP